MFDEITAVSDKEKGSDNMKKKPVIIIAAEDVNDSFGNVFIMNKEYADCIRMAGGIALGAGDYRAISAYAESADALLIPGGPVMHPARYGGIVTNFMEIAGFSATRDDFDFAIFDAFLKAGKPILGIGRGMQVINVALGGTLIRDIPQRLTSENEITDYSNREFAVVDGTPGDFSHHWGTHRISIAKGSGLEKLMGSESIVNSFHRQAVDKLGAGLKAVAFSEDGVIEAVEHESLPIMGVQWHPEHASEDYKRGRYEQDPTIFESFIKMIQEGCNE